MTPLRRLKDLLKYRVMGRNVRIIAVSEHLRRQTIDVGFNAVAIQTVQNGIDLNRAITATCSPPQVYEKFKIPPDKHLLLLFGWEPITKGVDVAMDAVERLTSIGLPITLGIVGTETLREFVLRRNNEVLPSWLHIIPPIDNVANLYKAASLFISASRNEGFPYSICEAMANGLPVVLSEIPGVTWARETPGATFFPSGNSTALAAAIREVLGWTTEEHERRIVANKQLINTKFTVSRWVEQILRMYREILGQN